MVNNNVTVGYDVTFELNEYAEPRIQSEIECIKNVLLFILFTKPGQYPSLPHIGLDIQNRLYSFYDDINESDLIYEITQQCKALNTFIDQGNIQIKKLKYRDQPSLIISVQGSESYPSGYMRDNRSTMNTYLIGITYDELNNMVYNINTERSNI